MSFFIDGVVIVAKNVNLGVVIWIFALLTLKLSGNDVLLKRHKYYWKELLFLIYMLSVLTVTGVIGNTWRIVDSTSFNIVFFDNESPVLMMLNVLLFVPFGILLPATFYNMRKWYKVVGVGICLIIIIELIQLLFVGRMLDVDDIFFGSIGVAIGYILFHFGEKLIQAINRKDRRSYGKGSISLMCACIAIMCGTPIMNVTISDILLYQVYDASLCEFRLSEIGPFAIGISGVIIGLIWNGHRFAKECAVLSAIGVIICLYGFTF